MRKKRPSRLVIGVIVAVIVVAVAVGVYLIISIGGANIAGASSLQFTANVTRGEVPQGTYTYIAKNMGTSNLLLRIQETTSGANVTYTFIYIVDEAQRKAWRCYNGTWQDLSSAFETQWATWHFRWEECVNNLAGWSSVGDFTFTAKNGDTVTIYDVAMNPTLEDSLFQPS